MSKGWIKLHRALQDNEMWTSEPFTRGQAWVDLLMLANHAPGFIRKRGVRVEVDRGQVGRSEESLASRWQWSRGKVRRFLKEMAQQKDPMIEQQKTNVCSIISIINYDQYQGGGTADGTADDTASSTTDGQQTVQQTDTNKKKQEELRTKKKEKKAPSNFLSADYFQTEIARVITEFRKHKPGTNGIHEAKAKLEKILKAGKWSTDDLVLSIRRYGQECVTTGSFMKTASVFFGVKEHFVGFLEDYEEAQPHQEKNTRVKDATSQRVAEENKGAGKFDHLATG